MEYYIFEKFDFILFFGYYLAISITWNLFIKDDRKFKSSYTEEAKKLFTEFILFIFPMVMFVSQISIENFSLRKLVVYFSILNLIIYYFILLILYFKNKKH